MGKRERTAVFSAARSLIERQGKSMSIHQGDQYPLPVRIMQGDAPLTPSDVTDLRIKVGSYMKSKSSGELTYDADRGMWLFPLTEEMTRKLVGTSVPVQVGVKLGTEIIYSDVLTTRIDYSEIKEEWSGA